MRVLDEQQAVRSTKATGKTQAQASMTKFLLDLMVARAMGGKNRRKQNRKTPRQRQRDERRAVERRAARDAHNAKLAACTCRALAVLSRITP